MSDDTPIAPVPDLATIVAEVERLAKEAHDFISRGKSPHVAIVSEWVPLTRKLKRRLEQLGHALDEVPEELWDIVQAGPEGAGHGLHLFPAQWQVYEADRHARIVEQLARLKSARQQKTPPAAQPEGIKCRPCYARDHLWLGWYKDERMKPAGIRDRWNKECEQYGGGRIASGRAGRDVVKEGLKKAKVERGEGG